MKYLILLILTSCVGAPDRWNVEYGTGDGSIDGRKGDYDTDSEWVALGVSGAIGGEEKLQHAPRAVPATFADTTPVAPEPIAPIPVPIVAAPSQEPPAHTPSWLVALLSFAAGAGSAAAWLWKGKIALRAVGGFLGRSAPVLILLPMLGGCSALKELPPLGAELHLDGSPPSAVIADSHRNVFVLVHASGHGELTLDGEVLLADSFQAGEWLVRLNGGPTVRGKSDEPLPHGVLELRPAAFWADLGLTVSP